jgi:NADH:ubiquinone oxidoreductase subunit D
VTVDLSYGWLEKCEDFCYWFGPKIDEYCPTSSKGAKVADIMAILGSIDVGSEQVA